MLVLSKGNRVTDQIPLPWTKNQLVQVALSEDQKGGIWIAGSHAEVLKVNLADHSILTFNLSAFADLASSSLWNPVCTIHLPDAQTWLYSANFSGKKRGVARPFACFGNLPDSPAFRPPGSNDPGYLCAGLHLPLNTEPG